MTDVPLPKPDKEFSRAGKLEGWFNRKTLRSYGEACAKAERAEAKRLKAAICALHYRAVFGRSHGLPETIIRECELEVPELKVIREEYQRAGLDAPSPAGSETPAAGKL